MKTSTLVRLAAVGVALLLDQRDEGIFHRRVFKARQLGRLCFQIVGRSGGVHDGQLAAPVELHHLLLLRRLEQEVRVREVVVHRRRACG